MEGNPRTHLALQQLFHLDKLILVGWIVQEEEEDLFMFLNLWVQRRQYDYSLHERRVAYEGSCTHLFL